MKISFSAPKVPTSDALVVFSEKSSAFKGQTAQIDAAMSGALSKAAKTGRFEGETGDLVEVLAPAGLEVSRVVLMGVGDAAKLTATDYEGLGGKIVKHLQASGEAHVTIALDSMEGLAQEDAAAHLAAGMMLRSYRFDKYRTKESEKKKPTLHDATIACDAHKAAAEQFKRHEAVISGVFLTRDLVSEPANIIYPESFAAIAKSLEELGVEVDILTEDDMQKLGMNALLGVGQGSARDSRLVVMRWNGGEASQKPLAFVGKGVTFDTGGISLKPGEGMEQMKWDMGGAGIVTGLMKALAARKAKANIVGVIGLVENMPSGKAQRPGDVVTSMSGQTIEVINTDAEGRLVLADALWYTQATFNPQQIIDLATLTGAIIISLGHEYAGCFTDSDDIAAGLSKAGAETGDKVWRLPINDAYDKLINCDVADMKNVGGRAAGSITAAQFLKRFTNNVPWAHIDVAGMVWSEKDADLYEKGATGYGVRLLDTYVSSVME
ncbi:putative cytosol aminopeptidase [Iodidimonas gelatinilytica]|uniref:Probable cytosol aminopeptidase n=1 Tax=Iodidimonas gelatinilytica TaxID=1236966 RepID=A0A5A7MPG3_9PROT|nr:leucyl aminopeptidase [Iodidimonas gelatinilytica]GEQ96875.1 putative cytosol aminopeptidase [Iodidimonas gelatinilytica]